MTTLPLLSLSTFNSSNRLQQLPPGVEALEALKQLDVSDNPLASLPEQVADLPALASLNCSNCKLQQLPERLGVRQPQLSIVNVAGNQLSSLPSGGHMLRALGQGTLLTRASALCAQGTGRGYSRWYQ
jgi:Leucine-rich repeat (LRR) protein